MIWTAWPVLYAPKQRPRAAEILQIKETNQDVVINQEGLDQINDSERVPELYVSKKRRG